MTPNPENVPTVDLTTIGGLADVLRHSDPEAAIYIDNRPPTALSSYRGYYDHLAIERDESASHDATGYDERSKPFDLGRFGGWYEPGVVLVRIKTPATVGEFIKALDLAVGLTFEGYKGGQYTMYADTDLWVSEYGDVDSMRIVGIEELPGCVDLRTEKVSWCDGLS